MVAYKSKTGRNQPSSSKFIFGSARWVRGLIQPQEGYGLAYIDWEQQEFGIAAALSGDEAMMQAYRSGDPYLAFAKKAGAITEGMSSDARERVRSQYKQCAIGVLYSMGFKALGGRLNRTVDQAKRLIEQHKHAFPMFWEWSNRVVVCGFLRGHLHTAFGWSFQPSWEDSDRTLRNFPIQANGAEILRIAAILATEAGVRVCAPVHDALLIEAPLESLNEDIGRTQQAMAEASCVALEGFVLRSSISNRIVYPERHRTSGEGLDLWETAMSLSPGG